MWFRPMPREEFKENPTLGPSCALSHNHLQMGFQDQKQMDGIGRIKQSGASLKIKSGHLSLL